jgi:hypothetical protein
VSTAGAGFLHWAHDPQRDPASGLREAMRMGITGLRVLIDDADGWEAWQEKVWAFYACFDELAQELGRDTADFRIVLGLPAQIDKQCGRKVLRDLHRSGHRYHQIAVEAQRLEWPSDRASRVPAFELCSELTRAGVIGGFGLCCSAPSYRVFPSHRLTPAFGRIRDYLLRCSAEEWRSCLTFLEFPFNPGEIQAALPYARHPEQDGMGFAGLLPGLKLSARSFRSLQAVIRGDQAHYLIEEHEVGAEPPLEVQNRLTGDLHAACLRAEEVEATVGGVLSSCRQFYGLMEFNHDLASRGPYWHILDTENELKSFLARHPGPEQEEFVSSYRKARDAYMETYLPCLRAVDRAYCQRVAQVLEQSIQFPAELPIQRKVLSFYKALPWLEGAYLSAEDLAPLSSCLPLSDVEPLQAMAALQGLIAHAQLRGWWR